MAHNQDAALCEATKNRCSSSFDLQGENRLRRIPSSASLTAMDQRIYDDRAMVTPARPILAAFFFTAFIPLTVLAQDNARRTPPLAPNPQLAAKPLNDRVEALL